MIRMWLGQRGRREHVLEGRKGTRFRLLGGRTLGGEASALYSTLVAVDAVRAREEAMSVCLMSSLVGSARSKYIGLRHVGWR